MARTKEATLHQLFPEWGQAEPATLVDLAKAEYESLSEQGKALRAMLVAAKHEMEREPILTASAAMELLGKHHLPTLRDKWVLVALDRSLQRVYAPSKNGGMRMVRCVGTTFPTVEDLAENAPLKEGGSYLAVYGGSPELLADTDELNRAADVARGSKITDVIFWNETGDSASFWSLRAGTGQRGSQPVEFPDRGLAERWWNEIGH